MVKIRREIYFFVFCFFLVSATSFLVAASIYSNLESIRLLFLSFSAVGGVLTYVLSALYFRSREILLWISFVLYSLDIIASLFNQVPIYVLLIMNVATTAIVLIKLAKVSLASPGTTSGSNSSLPGIKEKLGKTKTHIFEVGNLLDTLKLDIEDFGAETWQQERETGTKYFRTINNVLFLIDLLENRTKTENKTQTVDWVNRKLVQILEEEGVEEISTQSGDLFNTAIHKKVGSVSGKKPAGTVEMISRKGYFMGSRKIVIRPVEVITSSGSYSNSAEINNQGM